MDQYVKSLEVLSFPIEPGSANYVLSQTDCADQPPHAVWVSRPQNGRPSITMVFKAQEPDSQSLQSTDRGRTVGKPMSVEHPNSFPVVTQEIEVPTTRRQTAV